MRADQPVYFGVAGTFAGAAHDHHDPLLAIPAHGGYQIEAGGANIAGFQAVDTRHPAEQIIGRLEAAAVIAE